MTTIATKISRRRFLAGAAGAALTGVRPLGLIEGQASTAPIQNVDRKLKISPIALDIAPGKTIHTLGYNGSVPGPLIRWPEGKPFTVEVTNATNASEIVHWHGMWIPSDVDGAMEEGTPMLAPGATKQYTFAPRPGGMRWYHTHVRCGHDLKIGTYTGQFGFFHVEGRDEPGNYEGEYYLALHDWNAFMGGGGDASMDVTYDYASINQHMLGAGEPLRVKQGQQILIHFLNASATWTHSIALAGHAMKVIALDGNKVPDPSDVNILRLAPGERADVIVSMNNPGVWILGDTQAAIRKRGLGIVVEYAGKEGEAQWIDPVPVQWDYTIFADRVSPSAVAGQTIPLVFKQKFAGHGDFDHWTINGKSYPDTETIMLTSGTRYRLAMENQSADDHPVHLHRHSFEVKSINGRRTSGLIKDVLIVPAHTTAEVEFVANNPGATLFHCHQQSHMDFGFMLLLRYR